MNLLESLKRSTTVVADTGDIEAIAKHKPQDATTNPSLLFQAAQKPQYQDLVDQALDFALCSPGDRKARTATFMDKLLVLLCPLVPLLKPSRGQAIALFPVVEPCLLISSQTPVRSAVNMARTIATKATVQDSSDHDSHLW
jgi:hypothetical protein